jgi:NAD(P)-dependent dehydrogenase (short-subunit alcohol dehydrogenase family)
VTLTDRIAVVTGAGGAIGSEVVGRLVDAGATVVAADLTPPVTRSDARVDPIALDVTDTSTVNDAVTGVVERYGRIDILVNVAGVYGHMQRADRIDPSEWDTYLHVNLTGPFKMCRAVLPHMVERRWGRIVNIGSISSVDGGYRQAHYTAAKAGVIGLTRTVALEYAAAGITCNTVMPGPVDTPNMADAPEDVVAGALASIPAGRFATTGDIAAAVAFLVSPDAGYVNGVQLPVDGGALLLQFRFARKTAFPPPS